MTAWIMNTVSGYVDGFVSNAVAGAGSFAGDVVGGVGNGINGMGQSVEYSIRRYGDATKDYGNAIKDWTKADGVRQGTATNPLGLTDSWTGGKSALTMPKSNSAAAVRQKVQDEIARNPPKKTVTKPTAKAPVAGTKTVPTKKVKTTSPLNKTYPGTSPVNKTYPGTSPATKKAVTKPKAIGPAGTPTKPQTSAAKKTVRI
ncbi:hypothetical protein MMC24_002622 [Lignoscripta atroalba]|nr:hypothetical protein [Lignoscripta atroalba]